MVVIISVDYPLGQLQSQAEKGLSAKAGKESSPVTGHLTLRQKEKNGLHLSATITEPP
jgi:hypothetical protein